MKHLPTDGIYIENDVIERLQLLELTIFIMF